LEGDVFRVEQSTRPGGDVEQRGDVAAVDPRGITDVLGVLDDVDVGETEGRIGPGRGGWEASTCHRVCSSDGFDEWRSISRLTRLYTKHALSYVKPLVDGPVRMDRPSCRATRQL